MLLLIFSNYFFYMTFYFIIKLSHHSNNNNKKKEIHAICYFYQAVYEVLRKFRCYPVTSYFIRLPFYPESSLSSNLMFEYEMRDPPIQIEFRRHNSLYSLTLWLIIKCSELHLSLAETLVFLVDPLYSKDMYWSLNMR